MFKLTVKSNERTFTVTWTNDQSYKTFQSYQRQAFITLLTSELKPKIPYEITSDIDTNIHNMFDTLWEKELKLKTFDNLPPNPKVLDIGSGMGVVNMLAYQYLDTNAVFHLLDKDEVKDPLCYYSTDYTFYHSWSPILDAIETSNFDKLKFKFIEPTDPWDGPYDLITSRSSWCWHYPLSTYWEQVKSNLKIGGKLYLMISPQALEDHNIIQTISETFSCMPTQIPITATVNGKKQIGYDCTWIRNK